MVLEIHLGKRCALEKAYRWTVRRRIRRLKLSGRERRLWCWLEEVNQKRMERIIKFWHDVWCDDMPLKDSFPLLFTIVASKEA